MWRIRQLGTLLQHPSYYCLCLRARRHYETWKQGFFGVSDRFVHSIWLKLQPVFADLVREVVPFDFLRHPVVRGMFCRVGFSRPQQYELEYLRRSERTWTCIKRYKESPVGRPSIDCPELGLSANALGMLYYFARILEHFGDKHLGRIIEFGGGFGSLCRVFLELMPKPLTYVIVDLPEMLTLQYVYLCASSRAYQVIPRFRLPDPLIYDCVNLVPVHLVEKYDLKCDLFISTFALSEMTSAAHQLVAERRFFGARAAYIVGQNIAADLWRDSRFHDPEPIHSAARRVFDHVEIGPFHFADSWEMMAWDVKHDNIEH